MPKLDVLVAGATGQQGGAVAHALLRGGHTVRAMTRNLAHPAANTLRLRGARLAWTNLDDEKRLEDAAAGVDAIFAVTTPLDEGPAAEIRHGRALVELAQRLGVPHLVYSSAMAAHSATGVPHQDSKHEVEQCLRASTVPHTIVCPGFFMENLLGDHWLSFLQQGELALPLAEGRKLQQVACADLARFVRVVLERREEFLGQRICIASDELTPIEMCATLARIAGHRIRHAPREPGSLRAHGAGAAGSFAGLDALNGCADVARLRREFPEVNWHTLDGWARRQDWSVLNGR